MPWPDRPRSNGAGEACAPSKGANDAIELWTGGAGRCGGDPRGGAADRVAGTATTEQASPKPNGANAQAPEKPAFPTIVVRNGKPVGGIEELTYGAGERIRFEVTSNTSDEVHVHGYDVEEEVRPGRPAVFDFPASIEGVFEGELHGSGEQIVELRVEP
jgi:hypothetical protein